MFRPFCIVGSTGIGFTHANYAKLRHMETRKVINSLLLLGAGFALGWLLKPQIPQIEPLAKSIALPENSVKPLVDAQVITTEELRQAEKVSEIDQQTVTEPLLQRIPKVVTARTWTIEDILDAINNEQAFEVYDSNLFDYFRSKPELATQLLDQYLNLDDPMAKQIAGELLRIANSNNDFSIERQIIEKIQLEGNQGEWLSMLADFGINTPESMDFLSQQLDYSLQGQEITDALNAINKGSNRLFNKIPRQTRELITRQLTRQVNSSDPNTKAAAINALAAYPISDSESVIIDALSDASRVVQYSALQSLMRGEFQSAEIRDALMGVIRDDSIDLGLRAATAQTLRRYNLDGQDYDDLYTFNQELEARAEERRRRNQ